MDLFKRAESVIPGGVNSPVRAFKNVGATPKFIKSASGAYVFDSDNKKYIDYVCSWGPMILGHNNEEIKNAVIKAAENGLSFGAATELEIEMAELICESIPSVDLVRMVSSGTEAVMSALRVARGYTGKEKIIKFAGCYHGHTDSMLVKAGSGVMTSGVPDSLGITKGVAKDTLTATYNDLQSVKLLLEQNKNEVACIIVEPVAANMGLILPNDGFLQGLRNLCDEHNALLIFDEVITGFRLGFTGASEYFGVSPDLITYGKIIGMGMPVGAFGGKRHIMEMVSPVGGVYQAGTLSGNPIAMTAGLTGLKILKDTPEIYEKIENLSNKLGDGLREISKDECFVSSIGSLSCMFFTKNPVENYEDAKQSNTKRYGEYFRFMLDNGIYLAPAQYEASFISYAHTEKEVDTTLKFAKEFFKK